MMQILMIFACLCVLFILTAVSVTATVCAVIGTLTVIEKTWKFFLKFLRKIINGKDVKSNVHRR